MRKSSLEKLREAKRAKLKPLETDLEGLLKLLLAGDKPTDLRELNPTQQSFIYSPDRWKAYMGPAGCAKTSTGVAAVLLRALLQPGSKHLIARYDYNDLVDTTMLRADEMLRRLPPGTLLDRDKSPPAKWWVKSIPRNNPDGSISDEPSQITFMGLKDTLGSYEFNSAFLDEADELEEKRVHEVGTRLRNPGGNYSVSLAFNPPDTSHWLYRACTGFNHEGKKEAEPWMTLFKPEPRENVRNLPANYYEDMARSLPEDMRQRLVEGLWGSTFPGEPVYRQFRRKLHVVDELEFHNGATLFRLWDFGFGRPACIWVQVSELGAIYVHHELLGHNIEVRKFAEQVKSLTRRNFPHHYGPTLDLGDPAVAQKKDTGQSLGMLAQEGITVRYKHTPFDLSVQELRKKLESLVDGLPAVQIHKRCQVLVGALAGGYHLKKDGITPNKDGFYDHLADALRYGVWFLLGPGTSNAQFVPPSVSYDPAADVR